jgi:hypothetical protein
LWVLETKGGLHVASHSLLTEKVGNVIGAEGAGSMSLTNRGRHGIGSIFTNQEEQFADLPGQRAVGVGQATQVRLRGRTKPADQSLLFGRALRGRSLGQHFFLKTLGTQSLTALPAAGIRNDLLILVV